MTMIIEDDKSRAVIKDCNSQDLLWVVVAAYWIWAIAMF